MPDLQPVTSFLGWCSVINIGLLLLSTILLMLLKAPVARRHARLFGLRDEALPMVYFQYLGNYKLAILMFNIVPYLALRLMA